MRNGPPRHPLDDADDRTGPIDQGSYSQIDLNSPAVFGHARRFHAAHRFAEKRARMCVSFHAAACGHGRLSVQRFHLRPAEHPLGRPVPCSHDSSVVEYDRRNRRILHGGFGR